MLAKIWRSTRGALPVLVVLVVLWVPLLMVQAALQSAWLYVVSL